DFFLRENLRLRLLNARLALLSRDQWTYRKELKQAQDWIERYFDQREKSVQAAQTAIRQLSQAEINIALPNLNESLSAIKNFKLGKDVKVCPAKTIIPFYRTHVFAQVKPTTKTRIDLSFALRPLIEDGTKLPKRLIDTGGYAKKDRLTHRLTSL
ncbi:MAG: uroporphyrinogen-III C-methyltransferase, partial [Rhodospirillales bacterium]|nr:uroporphyrinogen-III C-methyltransferase [Rhodospirillales bacterium]